MFGKCRIVPKFIDDPPKSPLKRGTLKLFSPLKKGGYGGSRYNLVLYKHPLKGEGIKAKIMWVQAGLI
jgi:hypothetical protein